MKNNKNKQTDNNGVSIEENKKIFSDADFFDAVKPIIDEGGIFPVTVTGNSMFPFLACGRDTVYISKPAFPLKKGDIAFFCRKDGKIVMHRICAVKDNGYSFVGDAQIVIEAPVKEQAIFGVVKKAIRKGKAISRGDFCWNFFETVWIRIIRLRPLIMGIYKKLMW